MDQAPLIERKFFFDNPDITSSQISPCGKYITFLKEHAGILNLWIKNFDQPFKEAVLLTKSTSPILGYFWTYDSNYILFINDKAGDENYNIFRITFSGTIKAFPEVTNLTPLEDVTAQIFLVSKINPSIIMIGLNDRDKAWHDLYRLNVKTSCLELIEENKDRLVGWEFDWNEINRLAYRTDENGHQQILRKEKNTYTRIFESNLKETARIIGWTHDNRQCYLASNKGKENLLSLYLLHPETKELTFLEKDPEGLSDLQDLYIDHYSKTILFTEYNYDRKRKNWTNKKFEKEFQIVDKEFSGFDWSIISRDKSFSKCLIEVSGDNKISEIYYFNRQNSDLTFQYTTRKALKSMEPCLSKMEFFVFESVDGLKIPSYLSLPKTGQKPYPTIALIHGGPKGPRDEWGYNGLVQFLTNRGYAVFQPNFRSSGGFGKSFLNAGDKEWGKKMQDDITFGVQYLIDSRISDKDRIGIMGGSYGGYATLSGLAFTPDLYACGIDIVGPSNLFTLLETIPPYWEAGRKWLYEMVGDPQTKAGQKLLKESSPLFSAGKIKKPLLIVQGANDPRVKISESEQIVDALKKQQKPVYYLCAEDEGHGFRKPLNNLALYAAVEKFLSIYLGGRAQLDMEESVKSTLEKLTVFES
jgi:dipeptidyl aminopeptidase/acylaminoacyl peptidase